MKPSAALSIYSESNRRRLLTLSAFLIVCVALLDWWSKSYISLGFLYLFPIMLAGGFLNRPQIVALGTLCAVLQEVLGDLPAADAIPRMLLSSVGFIGTGLFVSELIRNRRMVLVHFEQLKDHAEFRRNAEEQLQLLVDSSPAAIVTVDSKGNILLANGAAQQLFGSEEPLTGRAIRTFLPALLNAVDAKPSHAFRTSIQCGGHRANGELFLAGIWFSTHQSASGTRLAAIVVDLSEDLRNREDLSFDYLLKNTRILMSAVSHEIRNLSGAATMVHRNLSRVPSLEGNADFEALGTLIEGLDRISSMELQSADYNSAPLDLTSVLDESRVLIDAAYQEADMTVEWWLDSRLPLVRADRYGLTQVFLNLAKNSRRAMERTARKVLTVRAWVELDSVMIGFQDTGSGISHPENLFRAFQKGAESTGLGLYVSRAIVKSFGGDLTYEANPQGASFVVVLPAVTEHEMQR